MGPPAAKNRNSMIQSQSSGGRNISFISVEKKKAAVAVEKGKSIK